MAIAEAVLTVIEEEGLQQNAKELGDYLLENLLAMQEKYECMGDVRGVGLFIGVDFVKDRVSREADVELAADVKYRYTSHLHHAPQCCPSLYCGIIAIGCSMTIGSLYTWMASSLMF